MPAGDQQDDTRSGNDPTQGNEERQKVLGRPEEVAGQQDDEIAKVAEGVGVEITKVITFEVMLPGFRPGKAPVPLIRRQSPLVSLCSMLSNFATSAPLSWLLRSLLFVNAAMRIIDPLPTGTSLNFPQALAVIFSPGTTGIGSLRLSQICWATSGVMPSIRAPGIAMGSASRGG